MARLLGVHGQLIGLTVSALAVFGLAAGPSWASPTPVPSVSGDPFEATVVNRHRHEIEALVWWEGTAVRLGTLAPGDKVTFALPSPITAGMEYRLLGDCVNGERIVSVSIEASVERRPYFILGSNRSKSYVRYEKVRPEG